VNRHIFGAAAHDLVLLAVIETGHGRRALPRPENGLRDLPALRYVAGLRLPWLGCGEGYVWLGCEKERVQKERRARMATANDLLGGRGAGAPGAGGGEGLLGVRGPVRGPPYP